MKNPDLKRAFAEDEYTPENIQELKKCIDNPIYFLEKYVKVTHPTKGAMAFKLYEYQKEMILGIHENKDVIILASRQLGKCVVGDTKIITGTCPTGIKKIIRKIISPDVQYAANKSTISLKDLFELCNPQAVEINDENGNLKFIAAGNCDFCVKTEKGWSKIKRIFKTIPFAVWQLSVGEKVLECADNHKIITPGGVRFVKDLKPKDEILTKDGIEKVSKVKKLKRTEEMYDIEIDDNDHVYYTNGILSHNTTVASMYILWFALFNSDKKCIIASKQMGHATEIMSRIKFAYEKLPSWIKSGCKFYNRTSIEFDNGSKIACEATSERTGRGESPAIMFIDEIAFVSKRIQEEMWSSLTPALSTGGKFILTSTPNGDSDLFATLWRGANSKINSFTPLSYMWHQHPDRGESYYKDMLGKLGELKTRQELNCLAGSTSVNTSIGLLTLEELYAHLLKDVIKESNTYGSRTS